MKNCEELWNVMKNCFLHVMKIAHNLHVMQNCSKNLHQRSEDNFRIIRKKIQQSSKHKLQIVELDDLWGGWIIGKNIWCE